MRLCRFEADGVAAVGFYLDDKIVPLAAAAHISSPASTTVYTGDHTAVRYDNRSNFYWSMHRACIHLCHTSLA